MGKFYTYLGIMSGLMLLFHFMGLIETGATPNSQLLVLLLNTENFSWGTFFTDKILLTITTGAGLLAGILVGFLSKNFELAAMVTITTWVGTIFWDFIAVYNVIATYNVVIATLLFAPPMFIFGFTLIDWWRGRD